MADLKRSRDSSSHGPSKLPRLSSFHPDEDLDNPVHTFVGRYMGMMRDRQERYNTLLAFASEESTEFQKFHAKIVNNERRLEQALAYVFEMTFPVHEELDAIENYELPRTSAAINCPLFSSASQQIACSTSCNICGKSSLQLLQSLRIGGTTSTG